MILVSPLQGLLILIYLPRAALAVASLALGYFLSPILGFGLFYSLRNSFHSATP